MELNTAQRNNQADAFVDQFDGGTLKIYTGASPGAGNAATGTLLVTINLPTPAFGAAVAGVASKSGVWSAVAIDTGTAGYARLANAGATKVVDITVGEGAGELDLDETDIVTGNNVLITAATITQPAS